MSGRPGQPVPKTAANRREGVNVSLLLRRPDDMHVHLRRGHRMPCYARLHARYFGRALLMPNTRPPITTAAELEAYRKEVQEALCGTQGRAGGEAGSAISACSEGGPGAEDTPAASRIREFNPLFSFELRPEQDREELRRLKAAGALCGKLYPKGVTTNSAEGAEDVFSLSGQFAAMAEEGIVLSVHGELPGLPVLEQEKAFLPLLKRICRKHPGLKIVLEHLSTKEAVETVAGLPARVGATITAHHLYSTIDDLLAGGLDRHLYCKPVLKFERDRQALREAACSGDPAFFFGSDSAPHPRGDKEGACGAAGIFSSAAALPVLAEVFAEEGRLSMLDDFCGRFGAEFYGLDVCGDRIELTEETWTVPGELCGAVPYLAGRTLRWRAAG